MKILSVTVCYCTTPALSVPFNSEYWVNQKRLAIKKIIIKPEVCLYHHILISYDNECYGKAFYHYLKINSKNLCIESFYMSISSMIYTTDWAMEDLFKLIYGSGRISKKYETVGTCSIFSIDFNLHCLWHLNSSDNENYHGNDGYLIVFYEVFWIYIKT